MQSLLARLTVRLCACVALAWLLWRGLGAVGLAVSAPLFGVALAKPLLDMAAGAGRWLHGLAWRSVDGRHVAYKGIALDVVHDVDGTCWVGLAGLRKVVAGLPADAVFRAAYPERFRTAGRRPAGYLQVEALLDYLARATADPTLRFRRWVERELAMPAQRRRERAALPMSQPAEGATPSE
jgi:hypothetical protein